MAWDAARGWIWVVDTEANRVIADRVSTVDLFATITDYAGADVDKAHATFQNGLLEVTVPITKAELSGRKIPIEKIEAGKKSKEIH